MKPKPAMFLGRNVQHDPVSRNFAAVATRAPRTILWPHNAPVLDQGEVGSCTGNAMAQLVNTALWTTAREKVKGHGKFMTEADALTLYKAATRLDEDPDHYLPTDTGSSGLAVAKAAAKQGFTGSYLHAFGLDHMLSALQAHPVICGTSWTSDMFTPNRKGFVRPTGEDQGGHEYLCLGADVEGKFLTFLNSWSDGWGKKGRFFITFADYDQLLRNEGDVVVPIPVP